VTFNIKIPAFFLNICAVCFVSFVHAEDSKNTVETLAEVSIIGSSELPNVSFDLPWRLPSIEKRGEQSPPKKLPNILQQIEPNRHKQKIHFSRFLKVDAPHFNSR